MPQNKYVEEFHELARQRLRETCTKLTYDQVISFQRLYGSIDEIPYDKMPWAYARMRDILDKKEGE